MPCKDRVISFIYDIFPLIKHPIFPQKHAQQAMNYNMDMALDPLILATLKILTKSLFIIDSVEMFPKVNHRHKNLMHMAKSCIQTSAGTSTILRDIHVVSC